MFLISEQSRKWWILGAMATAGGLIMLDETVVGVALPSLRHDLGLGTVGAHWVVNSYMLVFAGTAAAAGRLADLFGFNLVVPTGCLIFGIASLAAGMAPDGAFLIFVRSLQGLGAAAIFAASVGMIAHAFPADQRGQAFGLMGAIGTIFLALGPLVGGLITELISWRWIFWINVPIVVLILTAVLLAWVEPPRENDQSPPFDVAGLVTLVAGLALVIFGMMQGSTWGWGQVTILGALLGGVILLIVFVQLERLHPAPLIGVSLFRYAPFSAATLVLFAGQYAKLALVVFAALFLQDQLGLSPAEAGLALLPAVAAFPFLSGPVGRLADRIGARRLVLGGLTVATIGMAWVMLATGWDSYWALLPGLLGWGLAMPFCYAPTLRLMQNVVPAEKQGQVSGIGVTARLLGGTVGVAVSSTLQTANNGFQELFLVTAMLMLAVLLFAWRVLPGK